MIVANPAVTTIADMALRQQVLLIKIPLGAVDRRALACSPASGQRELVVRIDNLPDGFVQSLFADMALVDSGELTRVEIA